MTTAYEVSHFSHSGRRWEGGIGKVDEKEEVINLQAYASCPCGTSEEIFATGRTTMLTKRMAADGVFPVASRPGILKIDTYFA
jgi:hypothetical protein